jgi:hypothetical protein
MSTVDDYDLSALVGSQVLRVAFDDRVSLLLVDSAHSDQRVIATLVIEAAIALRDPDGIDYEIRPGVTATLPPMLRLLRCRVASATFDGRELAVALDDGAQFAVYTGQRYEAWDLRGLGIPNVAAGPWCLTDAAGPAGSDDRAPRGEPWSPLPTLDGPVYGLAPAVGGRRAIGAWDRNLGEQFVGVLLDHGQVEDEVVVTVGTVAKSSPLVQGPDDPALGPRVTGFEAALSQALFGLVQLEMPPLGEQRSGYLREKLPEMDQLALALGSDDWTTSVVRVAGADREAQVHHLGRSWAAAIDIDGRIALAMWGRGVDPSELELVEIDDLAAYAPLPSEEK